MGYFHYTGFRYLLTTMVFAMTLVLTPRAFVDASYSAADSEVPVDVLEQPDQCLWCTPPQPAAQSDKQEPDCDKNTHEQPLWLHPDHVLPQESSSPCGNDAQERFSAPRA